MRMELDTNMCEGTGSTLSKPQINLGTDCYWKILTIVLDDLFKKKKSQGEKDYLLTYVTFVQFAQEGQQIMTS